MSILCVHYQSRVESSVEYMTAESNDCILIAKPDGVRGREGSVYSAYTTTTHTRRQLSAHWGRLPVLR